MSDAADTPKPAAKKAAAKPPKPPKPAAASTPAADVSIDKALIKTDFRAVDSLIPYARNARVHDENQVAQLAALIDDIGWTNPLLVDDKGIIAGHGRTMAARKLYDAGRVIRLAGSNVAIPVGTVPCIDLTGLPEGQRRLIILADNQSALNASWDEDILRIEWTELQAFDDLNLDLVGFEDDWLANMLDPSASGASGKPSNPGSLAARFGVPPFSVLNAREGWWQERKAAWLALGIQSELGRGVSGAQRLDAGGNLAGQMAEGKGTKRAVNVVPDGGSPMPMDRAAGKAVPGGSAMPAATNYSNKQRGNGKGQPIGNANGLAFGEVNFESGAPASGTSIFDPVLCELAYRWFCPPKGLILDPFAGGSVRGIVAAKLGRKYHGVELRPEQVAANRTQAAVIVPGKDCVWTEGDSAVALAGIDCAADLVFTCPPYGDLEVYSELDADLSNMAHSAFLEAYRVIIAAALAKLKPNRFAAVVVGDFRDEDGLYRNFVSDTIEAFEAGGAKLYNEAILVTACGSLPIRAAKQFQTTRKLGKSHQNFLIFVKGDARAATKAIGPVEFGDGETEAKAAEAQASGHGATL